MNANDTRSDRPDTLHGAVAKLLAQWGRMPPIDRPLWLVNEMTSVADAFNFSVQQRRDGVDKDAVGRKPLSTRDQIADLLRAGQTGPQINEQTGASLRTITRIRSELKQLDAQPIHPQPLPPVKRQKPRKPRP